mmetsp:Transcript_33340/g.91984  ORF Transcript_33340/g.91984 Transcript_33340/m.91984 type:complete len:456 (-) Transcript_33340:64-1431(-)
MVTMVSRTLKEKTSNVVNASGEKGAKGPKASKASELPRWPSKKLSDVEDGHPALEFEAEFLVGPGSANNDVEGSCGSTSAEAASRSASKAASLALPADKDAALTFCGLSMKWVSLVALTLQTSGQVLLIKWARAEQLHNEAPLYLSSTVVFFTEVVKTFASLVLVAISSGGVTEGARSVREHLTHKPPEVLKAAVPALIYTVQNNLMFYSLEKLSAPVQQVLYQMKILTTAGLGVVMLGKSLGPTQWSSLFMLTMAVAMVQWPRSLASSNSAFDTGNTPLAAFGSDELKGFLAVLLACFTSGFAAVYIQKMMQQTTVSIWMRNVQFGLFGAIMGFVVAFCQNGAQIMEAGFTQGYSLRVVLVVFMNAFGGLLCAAMLKYAGATLGCFSTALSIVLTSLLSAGLLQDFTPDALFVFGAALAVISSLLYGLGLPAPVLRLLERAHGAVWRGAFGPSK